MDNSSPIYTEFLPISRADMEARGWDQLSTLPPPMKKPYFGLPNRLKSSQSE